MKKLFALVCLLCVTIFALGQKIINDPNVEIRQIGSFTGVDVSGGIDLFLSSGSEAVAVSALKPEYRERIKTEVKNGILRIWYDSKTGINLNFTDDKKLRVYVSFKTLNLLEASGGCDVSVDGAIKSSELRMSFSGGSDFKGEVRVENLKVQQSGGSDVRISGRAGTLDVEVSGASDFKGYDLVGDICDLEASGASDIEVTAAKELSAHASGASDIRYKGSPNIKTVKASGASEIKARG